jgi:hypothetical protein
VIDVDQALLRSFMRSLRNANRSHRSIDSYMEAARLLADFRPGVGLDHMTRDDVEAFMTDQLARLRPTGAAVRFRGCGGCATGWSARRSLPYHRWRR